MKNLINYLKTLWSRVADSQSTDISLDCRLTVGSPSGLDAKWKQNPFMRFAVVLTLIFTIGSGNVWGAKDDVVYKINTASTKIGNSTTYAKYGPTDCASAQAGSTVSTASWCVTLGSAQTAGLWLGSNSSNKAKMTLGNGSLTEASGIATAIGVTTSSTYYAAMICRTNLSKVYKVTLTYTTPGGTAPSEAWILYSTDNGSTWSVGKKVTSLSPSGTDFVFDNTITSAARYAFVIHSTNYCQFKVPVLTFYEGTTGGGCSNAVALSKGTATNGTVNTISSASVATCSSTASDRQVTITVKPDDCYDAPSTLDWTKSSGTVSASKQSGPTDNGDGTYSYVYQFAQNDNGAGTFGVTCTAKAAGKTVNFDAGPGSCLTSSLTETCDGSGVTLPAVIATGVCKGWTTFAGWATAAVSDSTTTSVTVYSAGSKYTPASNNMTLYAVYSKTKGGGSGFKLSLNSGGTDYYVGAKGSGSYMSAVTDAADAVVFTFANGYLSYDNSGTKTYISSGGNNTTLTVGTSVPSSTWTESGTTTYTYQSSATGNRYLGFNSGTSPVRFAPYGSSYAHAFTKHSLSTTYYCSDPNCCTPLGSINGSVSWSNAATAVVSWDNLDHVSSWTVKYKTHAAGAYTTWAGAQSTAAGRRSVTITGLTPCTDYDFQIIANPASGYCDKDQTIEDSQTHNWTVSSTISNVTASPAIPATTCSGFSTTITPSGGYELPNTITVTNADHTWNSSTGELTVSNVTGNVAITITGTVAAYFSNGATVFVQAESSSAWDASACVKAWFNNNGAGGAAQETFWLFDATGGDAGKKLFATVVPASGSLNQVTLQRFDPNSDCDDFWNDNGTLTKASDGGSNTFRSTGSGNSNVAWNGSGMTLDLKGDPNSWGSSLGTFADQGNGVWTATYNNYAPANAAGESQEFKISTNYNGWIGNTGSNNNATLDGMHVGSTYNITATLDVKDHSLTMSKTFVKGTVHFDLQGHGSAISDLTNVAAGSKISAPSPAPSVTGWDFGGWYKEAGCTNAWNFASDEVNETVTLYAKWTAHEYTITKTLTNVTSSPAIPSTYTYTGVAAGLNYTISPSDGYRLPTEITVSGTTYTWNPATGALALTGTISSNVTITIVAVQTHTVDWYVGGSAPANKIGDDGQTTVVDHGGKISDFPATTPDGSACDKVFVGWTNTSSYVHGTSPLFNDVAGSPVINTDASFYAVFAENGGSSYVLVESDLGTDWAGDYLIAYSSTVFADGRVGGTGTGGMGKQYQKANPDDKLDGKVVDVDWGDTYHVTLEEISSNSNTYLLKTQDGLYNYVSGNSNGLSTTSTRATAEQYPITVTFTSSSDVKLGLGGSAAGAVFRYNASEYFRYYANCTQNAVYLYKKTGGYTGHTINCADCGSSVTPTYTAAPTGGTVSVTKSASPVASGSTVKTCTAVDLTVTITPATHYTLTGFTATGLTTGTATISPAVNTVVPTTSEQTFTVTVSAGATGTLNLTPTFTAQTPLTITLSTNSKGSFTAPTEFPIYAGETFTFPDVTPNDPTCATFVGWIAGTTFVGDGTTHDAPATIAASTVSDPQNSNATYTAVFYETETSESDAYVKVTSTPANWANDHYLIVYEDGGVAFDGSRTDGDGDKIDAASNTVAVSITSSAIAATNALAASEWKIALISGSNYSIQSASGKYIGNASNSNALSTSSSALANTLSISSGDFEVVSDGGAYLRYNATSGQERFRYYKSSSYSSQQAIQLYKLGTAVVETRTYTTNPSCTPKYRVTVASVTGGSPSADPKYNPESTEVTITANPSAGYSFTEWRITKTTGGDNVTSTLLTGDKPTTASTTFLMPAYDVTVAASYAKKMVTELKVMDGSTVVANTTGSVSGTLNVSTGANKTLDVVITPSDAFDHSWTATVSAGSTYASITNVTAEGFRVNGVAQGDATITVTASNDEANGGTPKVVTFTVHVTDILPEEIILKRDGSNTPIETLIMYYDASESKGQYMKVNVSYSPSNPTNKAFTFSSAATGKVGSHSHSNNNGYEVLVANGVTTDPVNCTFTSSANGSVTKVLAVTVLPILTDRFVDYVHGNATQTVSARLSADRYTMITDINTPSLSDASDANPTSEDCETAHYHLIGWLPQATAEALMAAGTPITDATEGLVRAGVQVEATGQTWCAIWAEEQ